MSSSKTILFALLATLFLVISLVSAEDMGQTYTVAAPEDTLTYMLEGGESLVLNVVTSTGFDLTLTNTSSVADAIYAFSVTTTNTQQVESITLTYQYDETTKELYIEDSIKFRIMLGGVLVDVGGLVRDADAMTVNATMNNVPASSAFVFAIVGVNWPAQPNGFGELVYNSAPSTQTFALQLENAEKLEVDIITNVNFEWRVNYYGDYNPTGVAPAKTVYYFIELDVRPSVADNVHGAYRYYFGSDKTSVQNSLDIVQWDGAQWVSLGITPTVGTNVVTLEYQQTLNQFPQFNTKRHYAIVGDSDVQGSDSTGNPQVSGSEGVNVGSSNVGASSNDGPQPTVIKTVPDVAVTDSTEVSSASIKGISLVTLLVVIVAVLGL
jgi:hypothetical protein